METYCTMLERSRREESQMSCATAFCRWRTTTAAALSAMAISVCLTAAAPQDGSAAMSFGNRVSLRLDRGTMRAQPGGPALADKVDGSAFLYFRLLARQFAARACYAFRDLRARLPFVAVHGDAHMQPTVLHHIARIVAKRSGRATLADTFGTRACRRE